MVTYCELSVLDAVSLGIVLDVAGCTERLQRGECFPRVLNCI